MRVLICGSRGWHDKHPIAAIVAGYDVLSEGRNEGLIIIHGDAPGADRLAKAVGKEFGAEVIDEPADWKQHGRAAGPIRNQKMLKEHQPDVIWAFRSHGKSSGTDDMIERGRAAGIPTFVVNGDPRD